MRSSGLLRVALAVLLFAALSFGQRGNGGGGNYGGSGGRGGGGRPGGGGGQGPRDSLGGRPYPVRTDIALPTGLNPPAAAYTGIAPGGSQTIGPRSRVPYIPIIGSPIYYPGAFGYGSSVAPYNDPTGDVGPSSNMLAAQDAMVEQIRQLTADLQQMKASAPPEPAPAPVASPVSSTPPPASIPIQIVLRSGEQFTSKSYAVMNGMLWDFSSSRVRKVPVSSVDVAASAKATEENGGEFPNLRSN